MAGGGGGGAAPQGDDKNTYFVLWLLALVGMVMGVIWYFLHDELKIAFIYIRLAEWYVLYYALFLIPDSIPGMASIHQDILGNISAVKELTIYNLNGDVAQLVSENVGEYLKWPLSVILVILGIYIGFLQKRSRLKHKYSMQDLAKHENKIWPQIKVVSNLNIIDMDIDQGPWAMQLNPLEFAKKYQLISIAIAEQKGAKYSKQPGPEFKMILNRERTERLFIAQLGQPWRGGHVLLPHRKAILTVLIAKGSRDSKKAYNLMLQLANTAADGKPDYTGVDELFEKHSKNRRVQDIFKAHAFEYTVTASLLMFAREDGVTATSDFLWVKPLDRRFWYVLNNVGRQTPAAEVAGIWSHWYYELALKRPLSVPMVTPAVDALQEALEDIVYVATPEERDEIYKRAAEAEKEHGQQNKEASE